MKYRKKPVVVEAWKFTRGSVRVADSWVRRYRDDINLVSQYCGAVLYIEIKTLEGTMRAELGDYIIKGVQGELYPCKPDIFEATYELAEKEIIEPTKQKIKQIESRNLKCQKKSKMK